MTERLKLENPGDEHTMTASGVTTEEISSNNYYKFTDGAVEITVPTSSADRQLERLGVPNILGVVGKTVRISRSTSLNRFGKPYWNLDLATGAPSGSSAPSGKQPVSHSNVPNQNLPPLLRDEDAVQTRDLHSRLNGADPSNLIRYKELTQFVHEEIAPLYGDVGLSPEAAAACVATLYINEMRMGR